MAEGAHSTLFVICGLLFATCFINRFCGCGMECEQSSEQVLDNKVDKPLNSEDLYKPLTSEQQTSKQSSSRRGMFKERWQVGLLSCHDDVGLCVQSALCPCVAGGLVLEFTNTTSFCSGCVVTMVPVMGCCYICLARTKIRELHQIRGSWPRDLAVSFLLPPCVVCQAGYEIDTRPSQILNRF